MPPAIRPHPSIWKPAPAAASPYRAWLLTADSLTLRLQQQFRDFRVARVSQYWASPIPDEALLLGLTPGQTALIREVWLMDGDHPLVFARSILPRASLHGAWRELDRLGARPLGAVLFADPRVRRSPLRFAKLPRRHAISQRIGLAGVWARRSVFVRTGRRILVTEAFLPGVLQP